MSENQKANAGIAVQTGIDFTLTGQNGYLFYLNPASGIQRSFAPVGRLQYSEEGVVLLEVGKEN